MKKVFGYALAFSLGTMVSGSAVYATTNYVQALRENSTVSLNGNTVGNPPALVFGGTTYVQLYSIQQALKQAGIVTTWNGSNFNMSMSSSPSGSGTPSSGATSGGSSSGTSTHQQLEQYVYQAIETLQPIVGDIANNSKTNNQAGLQDDVNQLESLKQKVQGWNVANGTGNTVKNDTLSAISDIESAANLEIKYDQSASSSVPNISLLITAENDVSSGINEINNIKADLAADSSAS